MQPLCPGEVTTGEQFNIPVSSGLSAVWLVGQGPWSITRDTIQSQLPLVIQPNAATTSSHALQGPS